MQTPGQQEGQVDLLASPTQAMALLALAQQPATSFSLKVRPAATRVNQRWTPASSSTHTPSTLTHLCTTGLLSPASSPLPHG